MEPRKPSPSASHWFSRSWQTCIRCSFCSSASIPGTYLVQTLWYSKIPTTASNTLKPDVQLHTKLSGCNQPIWADELIKTLFILCCDTYKWLSGTWLVFTPLPLLMKHNTHPITVLTSTVWFGLCQLQHVSRDVSGCHYFCMEEFSSTLLLHIHFHVRHRSVRLPLGCHLSHGNNMEWNTDGKVQPFLPYHQHLPLTLWANITK